MNHQNLSVLAVNSLPANGNAGLKMVMSVLGTWAIPVPSLLLSGIGNMHRLNGFVKTNLPFSELLEGSLQIARQRKQSLILYVGYLGLSSQIVDILNLIGKYRDLIQYIVVDPVCGDQGKVYVDQDIISHWPLLLQEADLAFPNLTEVAILSGFQENILESESELYLEAFQQKFPKLDFVATSIFEQQELVNRLYEKGKVTNFHHFLHQGNFSGSGDTFASLFLLYHFFKDFSLEQSLQRAGDVVAELIRRSLDAGSEDLLIQHGFNLIEQDYLNE